jgi:hypothetical protein
MRLHQIKKLLHNKGNNYQNQKKTYRIGENLCQYSSNKGLIYPEYITNSKKLNTEKKRSN